MLKEQKKQAWSEVERLFNLKEDLENTENTVYAFIKLHQEEMDWGNLTDDEVSKKIMESLVCIDHWSAEEYDCVDFSLPEDVTNYLISVKFVKGALTIIDISMES